MSYRFGDALPKIGIRIIVDGRRNGVREKIEAPTRELAENVKHLIESMLRHPSGESVEAVISEISVGGISECNRVSHAFKLQNVGAVISITKAWAYSSEVLEMDKTLPQAIWGFNGSERPGAVYLAGAIATSEQKGLPIFKIYGRNVQGADDNSVPNDVAAQILLFSRAAIAFATLRNKAYLSVGSVSMGIGGSIVSPDLFQDYFGMRNEYVDMSEVSRRLELGIYDENTFEHALAWTKKNCKEMQDPNLEETQWSREKKDAVWPVVVKMALIMKDLMNGNPALAAKGFAEEAEGHCAIAAGFQGQRPWNDYMPNGDFMEAVLSSSFDWDGPRQPYIVATENDSLNAMSMLLGHLLTNESQIFADVRTFWSPEALSGVDPDIQLPDTLKNGFIYLTNSGAAALDGSGAMQKDGEYCIKPFYEATEADRAACLRATKWGFAKLASFRGGGFSSSFLTKPGLPMTMIRLNLIRGFGPVLQLAEGYSVALPETMQEKVIARTDPTWPKTFFVPRLTGDGAFDDVYHVMNTWGSNHCAISFGHIGDRLITLASMLRIPVTMHNVARNRVFRPSCWEMLGTTSPETADVLACQNFGPIYR